MESLTPFAWQQSLWQQLVKSRDQLPHALLLHGPRGIGKRHFARVLAQYLLCEAPTGQGTACGHCPSCALIAAGNHPDLRWLVPSADLPAGEETEELSEEAESTSKAKKASREILIDQVREIGEFLAVAAHRGGRRIVLLMPAEGLNAPAANALLKILEEPPDRAFFIAVSDEVDAVLPTVRSRCVLLRAPFPDRREALAWLGAHGVEDAEARLAEAGGAPVGLEREDDEPGRLSADVRSGLLDLLARGSRLTLAEIVASVPKDIALSEAIRLFQRWGWDLLAERAASRVRYYPQRHRAIAAVARICDTRRLLDWLGQLDQAQAVAEHPLNARLAVEGALIGYLDVLRPAQ